MPSGRLKVLVISHTYITKIGREKWRELQRLYDIELKIIVPTQWKDYLFTIDFATQHDDELDMTGLPVVFSGKEAAHWYRSADLLMSSFKPDILHVEEGTDALSYAQALAYKSMLASDARTLFFTWMNFEKRLSLPFRLIERYNLARSDAAICGNSDAAALLRAKGFTKPITVMPLLGIDPNLFYPERNHALREQLGLRGVVIGFIGRFVPEKGVLELLDAAAGLPGEISLLLIGGGALEAAIREKLAQLGLADRARIVLSAPHSAIPGYINAMDLLVLPSYTVPHWKEQFGQVLVQAMACGVPVLGSTHAEIPNVIGDAGMTFREKDWEDLHRQLSLLAGDAGLRRELAPRGRERVLRLYTNTCIATQTYEAYMKLLASARPA